MDAWLDDKRRSCRSVAPAAACRCFTLGEILRSLAPAGQERGTITPRRIGLRTASSAAKSRTTPACDWPTGKVFYQRLLSSRHALRERRANKRNASTNENAAWGNLSRGKFARLCGNIEINQGFSKMRLALVRLSESSVRFNCVSGCLLSKWDERIIERQREKARVQELWMKAWRYRLKIIDLGL